MHVINREHEGSSASHVGGIDVRTVLQQHRYCGCPTPHSGVVYRLELVVVRLVHISPVLFVFIGVCVSMRHLTRERLV